MRRYQNDPSRHLLPEADQTAATHLFWKAERDERVALTAPIVSQAGPTIVFCRTKHGADALAKKLEQRGVRSAAIHGNRSQGQRERALAAFTDGKVTALVATDVAARGIHVDAVACVVHFDPPADFKDYTHRSGRTAVRAPPAPWCRSRRVTRSAMSLASSVSSACVAVSTLPTPRPSRR